VLWAIEAGVTLVARASVRNSFEGDSRLNRAGVAADFGDEGVLYAEIKDFAESKEFASASMNCCTELPGTFGVDVRGYEWPDLWCFAMGRRLSSPLLSGGKSNRTLISRTPVFDVESFVFGCRRKREGDSGRSGTGMLSSGGDGGMGIVGMEYSLGKAWPTKDADSRFVGRENNRDPIPPSKVARLPAAETESFDETDDAGETPRIFDNS